MKRRILLAIAVLGVAVVVAIVLFVTRDDADQGVASTRGAASTTVADRSDRTRAGGTGGGPTTATGAATPTTSVADLVMTHAGGAVLAAAPAYGYTLHTDASGVLAAETPTPWDDVQTTGIAGDDGATYPQIVAAPDVAAYLQGFDAPGESVTVDASGTTSIAAWLASSDLSADCASDGPAPFDDGVFRGSLQVWHGCGAAPAIVAVVAVNPLGNPLSLRIVVQAATTADLAVIDHTLQTFTVRAK